MKTPGRDPAAAQNTPSGETRLHVYSDCERFSALMLSLETAFALTARDIGLVILNGQTPGATFEMLTGFDFVEAEDFLTRASHNDAIILACADRSAKIAWLFERGYHNVYDGERILREGGAAERFAQNARQFFLGPTPPTRFDPGAREASRFPCEAIQAEAVPRDKLFIINSMPKAGTLWMAAMLERIMGIKAREQIVISHVADLETDWGKANNHGAVCLTRDLRSVVVSWFHNAARTDLELGFAVPRYPTVAAFYSEFFLPTMLGSDRYYRGDLCRWLDRSGANYIPRLRYEDMAGDPVAALKKVLNAWRVECAQETIEIAARDFSFGRMADVSSAGSGYVEQMFRAGHARKGEVDGWKSELPPMIALDIERRFSDYQARLGYEPSASP